MIYEPKDGTTSDTVRRTGVGRRVADGGPVEWAGLDQHQSRVFINNFDW